MNSANEASHDDVDGTRHAIGSRRSVVLDELNKYVHDSFRNLLIAGTIGFLGRSLLDSKTNTINQFLGISALATGWILVMVSAALMLLNFFTVFTRTINHFRHEFGEPSGWIGWLGATAFVYSVGMVIINVCGLIFLVAATRTAI